MKINKTAIQFDIKLLKDPRLNVDIHFQVVRFLDTF